MSMDFSGERADGSTVWPKCEVNLSNSNTRFVLEFLGFNGDFEVGIRIDLLAFMQACSLKIHELENEGRTGVESYYYSRVQRLLNLTVELHLLNCTQICVA